eukprot:CAMPEP_0197075786 /NCGR_PEP_ID=MMETSP1384-20130603/211784_1 /TAXON_ID=29189 /ORGANISM="Ammonia sp." /LENGTH=669 /DNA_ID=CAMNT_0042514635 /DNA_START=53 /DNA_END=2062 /DNA_ORIENTATION=-
MSSSWSDSFNILLKQKEQIKAMLNLQCDILSSNDHGNSASNLDADSLHQEEPWKIIIYDDYCREIIAPLFSVQELQSFGITLYLPVAGKKRQKIPNVPAIYFVQPTLPNLDVIANDMKSILYDSFYLNFSLGLKRDHLEYLANKLIQSNSYHRLTKMYDQYINYISLSPDLFTLNIANCYESLNGKGQAESHIVAILNQIVDSLFCVLVSLQTIPIIRAQNSGAAQQIAKQLNDKISTHLKDRNNNLFSSIHLKNRPILILLERHIDFAIALHHSPIYESLLHDLLNLKSNHVHIAHTAGSSDKGKTEQIFLDYDKDEFWRQNALQPLPKVHEYHTSVLMWYQQKKDEIENNKSSSTPGHVPSHEEEKKSAQHDLLKSTIKSMPQLLQKKDEIDRHNKLMTSLSEILSERGISEYFHLEETLMHSKILNSQQTKEFNDLLSAHTKGTVQDKLRLFLIYYLCHHDVNKQQLNELMDALLSNEADALSEYLMNDANAKQLYALQYIIEHKKILNLATSKTTLNDVNEVNEEEKQADSAGFGSWIGLAGKSIFTQIKGMLPTSGKCTVTRIVQSLMNTDIASLSNVASNVTSSSFVDNADYVTFDPLNKSQQQQFQEFQQAMVFVVGGGSFAEYANLHQFANSKHKQIIYGCTDIVSPLNFLTQLTHLGHEQ